MNRRTDSWRSRCIGNLNDFPVHTSPNDHPPKMDVLPKSFLLIILSSKWLMPHSSTSHNQSSILRTLHWGLKTPVYFNTAGWRLLRYWDLKGQCHKIFWPFFISWIEAIWAPDNQAKMKPSGPLIIRLKWFCLKVCFPGEICLKFHSAQC